MKALFILISAAFRKLSYFAAFLPMLIWVCPVAAVHADEGPALVFEVKQTQNQNLGSTETQRSISFEQALANDPLVDEVFKYLQAQHSPLAKRETVIHILSHTEFTGKENVPAWMRALAISKVESGMCIHTPKYRTIVGKKPVIKETHNCSGITGGKGYRVYNSYEEWFDDMVKLITGKNYIDRPIEKYLKFYVQPGSMAWHNGVVKTETAFKALDVRADETRVAMANNHLTTAVTDVELALK